MFLELHKTEFINTVIVLAVFVLILIIVKLSIKKIGRNSGLNFARIRLISRYATVALFFIYLLAEAFVFGVKFETIAVVFSSLFAVIGIAFFAIWSILSNVTSGVIMFFSFPYKIGDKVNIHDKDFPIVAIIEDIRAFQLHLRMENGDLVTYPNNLILQKPVTLVEKNVL